MCTYSVVVGHLLITHFPHFHSPFHTKELSHHLLTLTVAQVFAVTLRPECKSAQSTICTCTLTYVRPHILGECNITTKLSSKRQGGAYQKTAAVYDKGWVERLPALFLCAMRTKEDPSPKKCIVTQQHLWRRLLCKGVCKGEQVLSS